MVDDHFGHCETYTVFTINPDKTIASMETMQAPAGCGCKSNIGAVLKEKGVTVLLAGNMGAGALNVLQSQGIAVFRGNAGDVKVLTDKFLHGGVTDSGIGCASHDSHHGEGSDGHVCESHDHGDKGFTFNG